MERPRIGEVSAGSDVCGECAEEAIVSTTCLHCRLHRSGLKRDAQSPGPSRGRGGRAPHDLLSRSTITFPAGTRHFVCPANCPRTGRDFRTPAQTLAALAEPSSQQTRLPLVSSDHRRHPLGRVRRLYSGRPPGMESRRPVRQHEQVATTDWRPASQSRPGTGTSPGEISLAQGLSARTSGFTDAWWPILRGRDCRSGVGRGFAPLRPGQRRQCLHRRRAGGRQSHRRSASPKSDRSPRAPASSVTKR